nr:hypothetical protein [Tanacetum cinerariifolium]
EVGINKFVHLPSRSVAEFIDWEIVKGAVRLDLLQSMAKHARKFFSHPKLLKLIEFPVLFLGATPENTPALYSLMNYADLALGTWYPKGGMHQIVRGMVAVAEELGVKIEYNQEHAHEIYEAPQWPSRPLFYASVPSKTDPTVAPAGQENLFLLIPVAPDLDDPDATR